MEAKRIPAEPVPPPPDKIQLTLTFEEARLLRKFAGCVAGPGALSKRKYFKLFSDIYDNLGSVYVPVSVQSFVALNGATEYIELIDLKD